MNEATGSPFRLVERAPGGIGADLREPLEQEELRTAYLEGRSLSFEHIVTLALAVLDQYAQSHILSESARSEPVQKNPLSEREQEVLHLVAEGTTSKQIGQQLFLSYRTVDHHLTSVFNKLGVDTRAQAVAVATRDGLL
jgi:DNA-binding NarL/FixJ family response regulator